MRRYPYRSDAECHKEPLRYIQDFIDCQQSESRGSTQEGNQQKSAKEQNPIQQKATLLIVTTAKIYREWNAVLTKPECNHSFWSHPSVSYKER